MLIDLTTVVPHDSPLFAATKSQENSPVAMGHLGTHLDTHEKSDIPLDYFRSRGVIFDVRGKDEIQISDIDAEKISGGDFVIFYTGGI